MQEYTSIIHVRVDFKYTLVHIRSYNNFPISVNSSHQLISLSWRRSLHNLADMSSSTYPSSSPQSPELVHYNGLCTQVLRATQGALLTLLSDALACPSTSASQAWLLERKREAHATCRLFEDYVKLLFGSFVRPSLEGVASFLHRGQEKASSASVTLSRLFRSTSTTNRVRTCYFNFWIYCTIYLSYLYNRSNKL